MDEFSKNDVTVIEKKLDEEKRRLIARIAELSAQDPFSDPERVNDNAASDSDATEESNHDRVAALVDELKQQVSDLDGALSRITDGTYGICSNCGKRIEPERLAILPTATLCLSCEKQKGK